MEHQQSQLWNGAAGQAWVEGQALLDGMFAPFEQVLVQAVRPPRHVLDVGCGTGATTLALAAARVEECVGIDISAPMIELARHRAAGTPVRFVCADVQDHAFAGGQFDAIVSRFGVMFFPDPVAAFANLRRAARPGAALCCIAWRSAAENPFMTTAERAAAPLLPALPPRAPDGPGQFAFADDARVRSILAAAGWDEPVATPLDVACSFPAAALDDYVTRIGPVGLALRQADAATRAQLEPVLRAAFAPFVDGDTVRFTAACWRITARAGVPAQQRE